MVNARFIIRRNAALMAAEIKPPGRGMKGRCVQRKIFRIEQMIPTGRAGAAERRDGTDASALESLKHKLALIQDAIAYNKRELADLIGDGKERRMTRAAGELGAAVDGMEKATVGILKAAEVVDESARALTATLKDDYKRGLAQDIQDNVVQIYEACNFQDLAGQRIGNVIRTLNSIEDQVAAMLERCDDKAAAPALAKPAIAKPVIARPVIARPAITRPAITKPAITKPATSRGLLNGPKLDGDSGHASQRDIDEMFG
jgi:chemotaxis protein CheZ